jgi:hypothetical protein
VAQGKEQHRDEEAQKKKADDEKLMMLTGGAIGAAVHLDGPGAEEETEDDTGDRRPRGEYKVAEC